MTQVYTPGKRNQPVISEETAAAAAEAWHSSLTPEARPALPPRAAQIIPDDGASDTSSRVSSYKRSLR